MTDYLTVYDSLMDLTFDSKDAQIRLKNGVIPRQFGFSRPAHSAAHCLGSLLQPLEGNRVSRG